MPRNTDLRSTRDLTKAERITGETKRIMTCLSGEQNVTEHTCKVLGISHDTQQLKHKLKGTSDPTTYVLVKYSNGHRAAVDVNDLY